MATPRTLTPMPRTWAIPGSSAFCTRAPGSRIGAGAPGKFHRGMGEFCVYDDNRYLLQVGIPA